MTFLFKNLVLTLFLSAHALSQSQVKIERYTFNLDLTPNLYFATVSSHTDPIEVLNQGDWTTTMDNRIVQGVTWAKLTIHNTLPSAAYLFLRLFTPVQKVENIFVIDSNLEVIPIGKPNTASRGHTDIKSSHIFSFPLGSNHKKILLIKFKSLIHNKIHLEVLDEATFKKSQIKNSSIVNILVGIVVMGVAVTIMLGFLTRKKLMFAYSALSGISLLLLIKLDGLIEYHQFLYNWWDDRIFVLLSAIYLSLFLKYFTFSETVRIDSTYLKFINILIALFIFYVLLTLPNFESSVLALKPYHLITLVLVTIILINRIKMGEPKIILFLIPFFKQLFLDFFALLYVSDSMNIRLIQHSLTSQVFWDLIFISCFLYSEARTSRQEPLDIKNKEKDQSNSNEETSSKVEQDQRKLYQEFRMASLGTLTNGLAHELNNPLAIIAGHQYRLASMIKSKSLNMKDMNTSLEKIGKGVKRVLTVIDALKAYSQDDFSDTEFSECSIRETVQFALDLSRERLSSLGVDLTTQPIPDTYIECNQAQIIQCILILIDNALDAITSNEKKTISVEYKQSVTKIEIAIIDNGPGVPIADYTRIFDPFYTTKQSIERKGLGLSIARGLIANHSGKLYLKPDYPQTCFIIQLNR